MLNNTEVKPMAQQPKGLYVLFFIELWERFSYWGIQSVLVLFLVKYFLFSDAHSYSIFGAYTALTFATSLLGGILADRFLGYKRSIILGALLIIIGNIILVLPSKHLLYLGLSIIVGGTGLIKPNSASQLGSLYTKNDPRRDSGFTIFYVGTNIGGILGPILYGFITVNYSWHTAFLVSAVGVSLGLIIYLINHKIFIEPSSHGSLRLKQAIYAAYIASLGLLWLLLLNPEWVGYLLDVVGICAFIGFLLLVWREDILVRQSLIAIFLLICFCLCFFACLFQCSTSLTLFIDRYVDRSLYGWVIPTETFVSLQPFFVVFLAPMLAQLWQRLKEKEPSAPLKTVIGLLFASLSFFVFMLAAKQATGLEKAALGWVIIGNVLLGIGELCVAPPILAAITQLAPVRLRSTLIGSFYLALAFAGYIASLIATLTTSTVAGTHVKSAQNYEVAYQHIFYLALALTGIALMLSYSGRKIYANLTHKG